MGQRMGMELRQKSRPKLGVFLSQRAMVKGIISLFIILLIAFILSVFKAEQASGANTGTLNPASASNGGGSASVWSSLGQLTVSDNAYVECMLTSSGSTKNSQYLVATNFGCSVPTNATIEGVQLSIERKASNTNSIIDFRLYLTKNGTSNAGSSKARTGTWWTTNDVSMSYGGNSDLWGTTLTPSDVNNTNFGFRLMTRNYGSGNRTAYIDNATFTVYYSVPLVDAPGGVSTGMLMWLKANADVFENSGGTDVAENNDNVQAWHDQSGNGYNLTQKGNNGSKPLYKEVAINYGPALEFDGGGNKHMATSSNPVNGDLSVFVVYASHQTVSNSSFSQNPALMGGYSNSSTNNFTLSHTAGKPFFKATSGSNFGCESSSVVNTGHPKIVCGTRPQATLGTNYLYVNGEQKDTYAADSSSLADPSTIAIGNHDDPVPGSQFGGSIAEVIAYSEVLSQTDREKVTSYLAMKYGITIQQDYINSAGTTLWSQSTNSSYHNRVTFIGRDDDSQLNQKQSFSQESGSVLKLGLGGIATSNGLNANTFSTNLGYVILGDNDAVLSGASETDFGTTANAESIDGRVSRVWKLQASTGVDSVEMVFDLHTFHGVQQKASTYDFDELRLLVDADGTFASGATSIAPTSHTYSGADTTVTFRHKFSSGTTYLSLGTLDEFGSPLPVELTYFKARWEAEKVKLEWETASETNSDYFQVERLSVHNNWNEIGRVNSQGFSSRQERYSFMDHNPSSGTSYYRLKQVDKDGTHSYCPTASAGSSENKNHFLSRVEIAPNPFTTKITVIISASTQGLAQLEMVNTKGKRMLSELYELTQGNNEIVVPEAATWESGTYVLSVKFRGKQYMRKMIKN